MPRPVNRFAGDAGKPGSASNTLPGLSIPAWQRERAKKLQRIFSSVEIRLAKGQTLHKALYWYDWHWQKHLHFYRCGSSRRVRFGYGTLRRLFYHWKKNGRTPGCLVLKYRCPIAKISPRALREFIRTAVTTDAHSFKTACRKMKKGIASPSAYSHALPEKIRRQIVKLFSLRRAANSVTKRLKLLDFPR